MEEAPLDGWSSALKPSNVLSEQLRAAADADTTDHGRIPAAAGSPYWYNVCVKARAVNNFDLTSPEAVERFRKAAKAFTTRSIKSQAAARKVLVDEGIYTKSGKLTKRYS